MSTQPWKQRVRDLLAAKNLTMKAASKLAGKGETFVRDILERDREPGIDAFFSLAVVLGTTVSDLLSGPDEKVVPIVGKAGAGPDGQVLFATGDDNFGYTPAPLNHTPTTLALEVQGNSMRGMADDGWIITFDDKTDPNPDHYDEPCVLWLEDGRVLVKYLYPGRGDGLFDLMSVNAPPMRDVPVRWAALITNIVPRRSARKFAHRNPAHPIEDVEIER